MVNAKQELMLNDMGWTVICYSPFEIQHTDGSFASGQAAFMCVPAILEEWEEYQKELKKQKNIKNDIINLSRLYEITNIKTFDNQLKECKNHIDYHLLKQHYIALNDYEKAAICRDKEKSSY